MSAGRWLALLTGRLPVLAGMLSLPTGMLSLPTGMLSLSAGTLSLSPLSGGRALLVTATRWLLLVLVLHRRRSLRRPLAALGRPTGDALLTYSRGRALALLPLGRLWLSSGPGMAPRLSLLGLVLAVAARRLPVGVLTHAASRREIPA